MNSESQNFEQYLELEPSNNPYEALKKKYSLFLTLFKIESISFLILWLTFFLVFFNLFDDAYFYFLIVPCVCLTTPAMFYLLIMMPRPINDAVRNADFLSKIDCSVRVESMINVACCVNSLIGWIIIGVWKQSFNKIEGDRKQMMLKNEAICDASLKLVRIAFFESCLFLALGIYKRWLSRKIVIESCLARIGNRYQERR